MGEGTVKHSKRSNTQYCQVVLFAITKGRKGSATSCSFKQRVSQSREESGKNGTEVGSASRAQLWKGPGKERPGVCPDSLGAGQGGLVGSAGRRARSSATEGHLPLL